MSENPKTKRKETKNADLDYAGPDRCDAGDGSGEGQPQVTAGVSRKRETDLNRGKEAKMISTIVLMGTLVTLLIVQD